jgi:hypothetical protein
MADKKRLKMALASGNKDLTDYAIIRNEIKFTHEKTVRGAEIGSTSGINGMTQPPGGHPSLDLHEVFEWTRPFDDFYAVMVNGIPVLKGGFLPILYDFKESPFIDVPYLKVPGEFEGYGVPLILENPQLMLNQIKNQRLDAAALNIHKMWIVNPLANTNRDELVTRPFGIIYSSDPNGVREVQFSDVKASAYKEEELLKNDMRYSSGVDDTSMGSSGGATSATEVRHLRESTLERVRLFVNHLGDGFSDVMRYWISMYRQLFTKKMHVRVLGEEGINVYPLIEKDDLMGQFDYRASVLPSIAGQNDIKKKQDMDLFQLLITLPFVDPRKLTSKILHSWNWSLDSVTKNEEEEMPGMPGQEGAQPGMEGQLPPEMMAMMGGGQEMPQEIGLEPPTKSGKQIPPEVLQGALAMLRREGENDEQSGFSQASRPINLLQAGPPPTVKSKLRGANPRGMNRGGKVNTNITTKKNTNPEAALLNRTFNIQR